MYKLQYKVQYLDFIKKKVKIKDLNWLSHIGLDNPLSNILNRFQ